MEGWDGGVGEGCAHLVGPGPLAQPSLAVVLGAQVPGVWGPPRGWGCTRSLLQAPRCQVPQALKRPPLVAWPHPAPIFDCWAPGSAGRLPVRDCEMPQGWGGPLLQPGALRGPGALALVGWAPGDGLGGLTESEGVRPSPPPLHSHKREAQPAEALPPAGVGMFVWNGIGHQLRDHSILVPTSLSSLCLQPRGSCGGVLCFRL